MIPIQILSWPLNLDHYYNFPISKSSNIVQFQIHYATFPGNILNSQKESPGKLNCFHCKYLFASTPHILLLRRTSYFEVTCFLIFLRPKSSIDLKSWLEQHNFISSVAPHVWFPYQSSRSCIILLSNLLNLHKL
jgi:hypothetical protein